MNFLMLRSTQTAAPEQPSQEVKEEANYVSKPNSTLEGLIAQDPFPVNSSVGYYDGVGRENGGVGGLSAKNSPPIAENHIDVSEDDGWITIPYSTHSSLSLTCLVCFHQVMVRVNRVVN